MSQPTEPVQVSLEDENIALAIVLDVNSSKYKFSAVATVNRVASLIAAHRVAAERAALQMAARIARKPRILDAMKGVVATPDFGEEIAVEIEACPTVSAAQTGENE